jgi:hypothetical protein
MTNGRPLQERGMVATEPGLYFAGLIFPILAHIGRAPERRARRRVRRAAHRSQHAKEPKVQQVGSSLRQRETIGAGDVD